MQIMSSVVVISPIYCRAAVENKTKVSFDNLLASFQFCFITSCDIYSADIKSHIINFCSKFSSLNTLVIRNTSRTDVIRSVID